MVTSAGILDTDKFGITRALLTSNPRKTWQGLSCKVNDRKNRSMSCLSMASGNGRAALDDTGDQELIRSPAAMTDMVG